MDKTTPKKRKIIQIVAIAVKLDDAPLLYALCDDGTLWIRDWTRKNEVVWQKHPDVPQN